MPGAVSELEAVRLANIEERNRMLKELFGDKEEFSLLRNNSTPRTVESRGRQRCRESKFPKKVLVTRRSPPRTRFGGALKSSKRLAGIKAELDSQNEEEDDDDEPVRKKRTFKARKVSQRVNHSRAYPRQELNPEDVTEEMLSAIAVSSYEKVYSAYGTSCHQCRQKTLDTKTICRGKDCFGVRGQFCGPCLAIRYGEFVADALRDPNWSCPSCRHFCNCSFCMEKEGKCSTGIMIHTARKHGFTNVKDYLASKDHSEDDDDSAEQTDENDEPEEEVRNYSKGSELVVKDAKVLLTNIKVEA